MTTRPSPGSDDPILEPVSNRPATSRARATPPGMWQPPSLEEMQGMLPQYQFECLLGHGGMGAVFKAVQVSLDRAVAIKVLPGDLLGDTDAQFTERFKNEARVMAKMNHPAIVDVHDFGVTQTGLLYFVMEFIDGTDVSKMISASGRLPPEHALAITAHVCDALHYAHTHGVIHRDIKPANVLINMEGQVKVADFGLAKASDPNHIGLTRTNMAMGTPDFVAPEAAISGIQLDGRADIYAVGVMLYQMLTGSIPRGMWTMPSILVQTDPRFDAIIGRAMQVDRESRYQAALDLRRDLDVILTVPYVMHDDRHSSAAVPKEEVIGIHRQRQAMVVHRGAQKPAIVHAGQPSRRPQQRVVTYAPQKKGSGLLGLVAAVILGGAGFYYFQKTQKPAAPPAAAPSAAAPAVPIASAPIKVAESAPRALTSPSTPSAPVLPAASRSIATGTINLLASDVVRRDAIRGEWQMTADGLVGSPGGIEGLPWHMVTFDAAIPAEYDFEADFTLVSGTREASLILPIQGRQILWKMGFGSSDPTPFSFGPILDGLKPDAPARTEAKVMHERLKTGQRYRTRVEVRRDSLRAILDGKEVLRWAGDLQRLRLNGTEYAAPDPTRPGVGGYNGTLVFHRAEISPASTASGTPALASAPSAAPDALAFGGHYYQFVPDKTLTWMEAKAAAEKMGGHLATITSKEENDWIASTVIAKIEQGLGAWIGGTSEGTPGSWRWITGEPFTFTAWSINEPSNRQGEPAILFSNSVAGTLTWADMKGDGMGKIDRRGGYLIEWDQAAAPALASGAAAPPIDLLASVNVQRDTVKGTWELKPTGLVTPQSGGSQVLEFNQVAPEEYDFEIEFTATGGTREVVQILPLPGRSVVWKMCPARDDPAYYGFGPQLDGKGLTAISREARTQLPRLKIGQRYRCLVEVRKGSLRVELDQKEILKWSGDFARFSLGTETSSWALRDPRHPAVAAYTSDVTFHKAELRLHNIAAIQLAEFESQFKEAWERDVTRSAAGKAIASLDTQYLAALDRALADATKAGSLDDVTALNAEKKRVADQAPLPAADPASLPASLGKLRATYRKAIAPLIAQRAAAADPVYARYDAALAAFETELSQKGAAGDAQRVQARRAEIALLRHPEKTQAIANVATAPATAPGAPAGAKKRAERPATLTEAELKETPPKPFTPDEAIQWALSLNGSATILKGRDESQVLGPATMPKGKYTLVALKIGERQTLRIVDLAGLADLADLRELVLNFNLITDDGLAFLPPLPKLESLNLHECGLTDASFSHLAKQRALTRLGIGNNQITAEGIGIFSGVAALKSLDIGSSALTSEGVRNLTRCTALTTLDLSGSGNSKCASLAPLSSIATLRSLRMVNNTTDALVQSLATVTQLESLDLSFSPITDSAFDRISSMTSLRDLTVHDCKNLTDTAYLKLVPLGKTFTRLIPTRTKLSDAAFAALAKAMPMLAEIDLGYTGVSPAGLAALDNFKRLKSLAVHAQQCTEEGLRHLSRATNNLNLATFGIREIETLSQKQRDAVRRSLPRYAF